MIRSELCGERHRELAARPLALSFATFLAATVPAAALAQQTSAPAVDSVLLEADSVVQNEEAQTITAEGNVEARYQGRTLRTDRLVYNMRDKTIRAQGSVQITDPDGTIRFADEVEIDETLNTGVATDFSTRIAGGGVAAAAAAVRPREDLNVLYRVVYTACPICTADGTPSQPTWQVRARRAVQDQDDNMISYRDFVLQIGDIPVFYLPYFAHPDPSSGARSGLLPPDGGKNRRLGVFYEQPVHVAISPYQDLTLIPRFHEKVDPILGFQYRKRFYSGAMRFDGSAGYDQEFDGDGETYGEEKLRGHLFAEGQFKVNDLVDWGFGIERASDDFYLRRYDIDIDERPRVGFWGDYLRLVSQAFVKAQDEDTFGIVSVIGAQGLRETDRNVNLPLIAPLAELEHVTSLPVVKGQLKLQASAAQTVRDGKDREGVPFSSVGRVSVGFDWRREEAFGPGIVASPFVIARGDAYDVQDGLDYAPDGSSQSRDVSFARGVGVAGAEVRWPFLRSGETADVIIEPIAMAALGTNDPVEERLCINVDQRARDASLMPVTTDIPRVCNEDSLAFELDDSNLFQPNAAPNYDLWEPGARASYGVRATARSASGAKSATVMVGRRWRENPVPAFSRSTNLDRENSDYVASITGRLGARTAADVRYRFAEDDLKLQRMDAAVRTGAWRLDVSGRYFRVEETLRQAFEPTEEITVASNLRLTQRWSLGYAIRRDLNSDITLSQNARLLYQDDCAYFELAYERRETFDRVLGPDEGVRFRFGFRSLGEMQGS